MIVELECISQHPLPEIQTKSIASKIPIKLFYKKLFVIENLQIEEYVTFKGIINSKFSTGKYDNEFYKFNIPYNKLRDMYFAPITINGFIR